jgi:hypothetical protein
MDALQAGILAVGILIVCMWIWWRRSDALLKKYSGEIHFRVGKYLVGLDNWNYVTDDVECVVAPHYFVFAKFGGEELGRVARNSIEEVAIDDKSQITQRLTATRMVAFGVFALAAPKARKIKEWCVALRWVDGKGLKRSTVFEFTGSNPEEDANKAANMLMRYVQRPPQQTEPIKPVQSAADAGSKTCPYCAETIKLAAIVCRFCNRELPKDIASSL